MKIELELKNGKRRKFHPQVAKVLIARGMGHEASAQTYQTREMRPAPAEDLTALRAEYQEVAGKRAFHGWGAAELRKRIAEFKAED